MLRSEHSSFWSSVPSELLFEDTNYKSVNRITLFPSKICKLSLDCEFIGFVKHTLIYLTLLSLFQSLKKLFAVDPEVFGGINMVLSNF